MAPTYHRPRQGGDEDEFSHDKNDGLEGENF
jgi:hypothetical protein